ncbi:cholinesterase-like [Haemaphysalis longicornis]
MMPFISTAVVIAIAMAVADPIVETDNGKILGMTVTVFNGTREVDVFLGIPYATPPVGERRFRPSVPAPPWKPYVLQATKKSAACIQFTPVNPLPPWVDRESEQSEDCLYLNIWRPHIAGNNTAASKDVMVWIHGGGLNFGSASMDIYDGAVLAAEGDVIVVSMNYRLGAFGFLTLPNDTVPAPGNQGLLDQVLAMRWIHDHIAHFGGDPKKVTLFGESAGGWSIGFHTISPVARPLFQRAIIQSAGTVVHFLTDSFSKASMKALELAESLGCTSSDTSDIVPCLQKKTARHLALMEAFICAQYIVCFSAVYGDEYLPHDPVLEPTESISKQFLLGNVENEGSVFASLRFWMQFPFSKPLNVTKSDMLFFFLQAFYFVPLHVSHAVYNLYVGSLGEHEYGKLRSALGHAIGDAFLLCPEVFFGERLSQHDSEVYYYNMVYHSTTATHVDPWMGLTHFEDVQYVFGVPLRDFSSQRYSEDDKAFSRKIIHIWSTFAKSGAPPPVGGEEWPMFDTETHSVVSLDRNSSQVETLLQLEKCRFWETLTKPNTESSLYDCS